jgi:hypothetical protein
MKSKTIKTTHIDTGGHGYLSVSKEDFLRAGCEPTKVSTYSGHTLTRLYLEEDCDASYFIETAKANGFEVEVKSGYNLYHSIHHNYNPELFAYVPKLEDVIICGDGSEYKITSLTLDKGVNKTGIIIQSIGTHMKYRIGITNPFEHIKRLA